jgi:hypothetical protein
MPTISIDLRSPTLPLVVCGINLGTNLICYLVLACDCVLSRCLVQHMGRKPSRDCIRKPSGNKGVREPQVAADDAKSAFAYGTLRERGLGNSVREAKSFALSCLDAHNLEETSRSCVAVAPLWTGKITKVRRK